MYDYAYIKFHITHNYIYVATYVAHMYVPRTTRTFILSYSWVPTVIM